MFYCVHYYKDAMLSGFYAICNCCSCCCGAMQAYQNGPPMLAFSGYVAQVDADLCADLCQFEAIAVDNGHGLANTVACMSCGACVTHCPEGAMSLLRDPSKGEPLVIQELMIRAAQAGAG